ncbi:TonB-dependent receptor [Niveispirillum sp. KHB5.9]|uniref:TonB-dependent receptor n=1 Tax=Niveispirillum sp. KHB5.9 TaxID=3400269 RepID=UPI003A8989E3
MRGFSRALLLGLVATVSHGALAQEQNPAGDAILEEIIVTALKRSQPLQEVPASVTVVEGEAFTRAAVVSLDQITQVVPGIRMQSAPGGTINPVVRGLGTSSSNDSFEQTIGLFIDGVFAGHARDYAAALFDVERVEIVKGTQAAILGKNTSVGALTLTTKKPGSEFAYEASYMHEFELGSDILDAAINLPVNETFAIRVAGQFSDEGGWIRNALTGEDEQSSNRKALRATARWEPTDNLEWIVSAQAHWIDRDGQTFYAGADTLGRLAQTAALYGDPAFTAAIGDVSRGTVRPGFDKIFDYTQGWRTSSTINLALGDHTLTAVTGYAEYDMKRVINPAGVRGAPVLRTAREHNESFGQELRLTSPEYDKFSYIAGAYYYHDKWGNFDFLDVLPQAGTPLNGAVATDQEYKTEAISLFGQFNYSLTEELELTLGLRSDNQKKQVDYTRAIVRPGLLTTAAYPAFAPTSLDRKDDFVDYSGSISYKVAPGAMLYASYATGSKGGGFQASPSTIATAEFGDEGAKTVELGGKFSFGRGTTFNVALFQTRIADYQIAINTGAGFVVRNDQIQSRGADAELSVALTPDLTFSTSVTYADVEKRGALPANSIAGIPFAPKLTGVVQMNYETALSENFSFNANAFVEFRTEQHIIDLANAVIPTSDGYAKLNLRVGLAHDPSGVELALVGKNLTDKRVVNYGYNAFAQAGAAIISTDVSRTIGLQASIRY